MQTFSQLSEFEFERSLRPEDLRKIQLIHAALMGGPLLMAVNILILHIQTSPNTSSDTEFLNVLSIFHAVFAAGAFGLSRFVFDRILSEKNVRSALESDTSPYNVCLLLIRNALIVRMAIMEGAAFFGLVVCIIAASSGRTHHEPLYFLNLSSYVLLLVIGIMIFPTTESLKAIFRNSILRRS